MLKGYKYRIFPTDDQKDQLQRYFGVNRLVYNLGLETKTVAYASNKTSISKYDLIKQLPELRNEFDYIKECPSQVLQHSIINLDTAYQNFFKGKGQFPKYKNRYSKQSITFPQGFDVDFDNNILKLPKLKDVAIDYHRNFKGLTKRVTLTKTVTGKYFVSLLVDTNNETPIKTPIKESTTIGVDFGIKDLAITSDGVVYENKNFFKSQQKRLRIEQRSLARKRKGSKNREKQKLVVALLQEKIRNQRTDYLHKISTELVNTYDTIVLEDLAVSNMVKNHNLAKAIAEMGWRQLRTMLEYKAEWQGKNLVVIGRFKPSSKICSNCGNHKKDLKLSDRTYNCDKCGNSIDRDLNAAYNIKNFGVRNNPLYDNVSN
jgi:putative transposase